MTNKDITTIHNALLNEEITSLNLIKEANDSILKNEENVNAYITKVDALPLQVTDNLLSGIPYALKDNISTRNIKTTAASNTLLDYEPIYNATVYEKLNNVGAVLIGKTNLDELAMGGTGTTGNIGVTHNPYNINRIAGGSSAGSAATVALGQVPFAIGSDTGDSVRKPAAYCGIVGYKPSYGLISRYGLFAFASSLDHIGVFTRNVLDSAIVVNELKGYDEKDMTSITDMNDVDLTNNINKDVKGKKLFVIKELINKDLYKSENTKKVLDIFDETITKCKNLGIEVYEESIDINLLNAIKPVYDSLSCAEATSNNSNLNGLIFGPRGSSNNIYELMKDARTKGFSSLIKRRFVIGSYILQKENQEKYFLNAKRVRRLLVNKFNELFKKYDGMIMPASGNIAPLINNTSEKIVVGSIENVLENYMAIANFGGFPSITIPNGFIDDMPIGINITSKFKDDCNLLNIANKIESTMNYKNQYIKEAK